MSPKINDLHSESRPPRPAAAMREYRKRDSLITERILFLRLCSVIEVFNETAGTENGGRGKRARSDSGVLPEVSVIHRIDNQSPGRSRRRRASRRAHLEAPRAGPGPRAARCARRSAQSPF
ncbi:hypothetical protein EVAR_65804_1 [Eumeta japonica]|uniref:Uncharacterized protein n=1 Tax=Eumeta variegata TaxID=151549 RepID=A0A4C1ZUP9_EUMVA|nr:hypothetical protein EVAR_65804_1 [Eumeta japonica]